LQIKKGHKVLNSLVRPFQAGKSKRNARDEKKSVTDLPSAYSLGLTDDVRLTLLHFAAALNQAKVVDYLLKHKASPRVKSSAMDMPLHAAAFNAAEDAAKVYCLVKM
jgi:ankyrin repeat protein